MRSSVLYPPVMDLPPPLDARVLRVMLVQPPQAVRRTSRLVAVVVVRVARTVVRWVLFVVRVPSGRRGVTVRARGPPS